MVYYINFIFICLAADVCIMFSLKVIFKLKSSILYILFLQVFTISISFIYLFCGIKFYQFVLLKSLSYIVINLLITDYYKIKVLVEMLLLEIILMFSVYGIFKFLTLFVNAVINEFFCIKIDQNYNFIIIFCLLCYFFAIFWLMQRVSKTKKIRSFLSKVSFYAFGKHIQITGLIDTGNSLYDSNTGKAVAVVEVSALKKYLSKTDYNNLIIGDYSKFAIISSLSYVSVGGKESVMPIINIGSIMIENEGVYNKYDCVLGIVNQKFKDGEGYQILLHRDFV